MHQGQATSFGALLRRYRMAAGLTQEELAERAGLSVRTVSDLERGVNRSPRKDTLPLLAAALGLMSEERRHLEAASRQPDAAPSFSRNVAVPSAPPLVGRTKELALLERHLAGDGPPVLLLAGEPGIGKTRLLQAAMDRARDRGWRALDGGCQRRGGQEPYAPLLAALQRYLRGRSPAQVRGELQGCAWLVRLLPELAGGPIEPLPAWSLTPEHEHRLMTAAAVRFLANVAGPSGTLLVLDDLQWAGPEALELLATLVRTAEASLRVIGAYRDSEVGASDPLSALLADLAHAGQVARRLVAPLLHDEATELLAALLPDGTQPTPRDEILRRAAGVPFFLMSWAQAVVQGEQTANEAALPWTVAQSVRQRVRALPEVSCEVLGVAAVIGRVAPRSLLAAVVAQPESALVTALDAACRARLLEEHGHDAYRFVHDVIRETVEADLGAARRAMLHRRVAEALERHPGPLPAESLAYHYGCTDEHLKAAYWLERAGDEAAAGFANAMALEHYAAARGHLHMAGADAALLSRLDEKAGDVRVLLGDYTQACEDFARARTGEREAARRAELWRKEGIACYMLGEFERALAAFAAAVADGDGMEVPGSVRAAVEVNRGETLWRWGQYNAAQQAAERALDLLNAEVPGNATGLALARAHHLLGRVAMTSGDFARAEACHRRSLALYERLGDQQGSAAAWADLSWDASLRGDLAQAEECSQHSLTICERIGDQDGIGWACNRVCWCALLRGDLMAAEEYARRELATNDRSRARRHAASAWCALSVVACEQGNLAEAEDDARRALAILERSEHQGGPDGSSIAWNLLGTVLVQRGALAEAEECYRRGLDIIERIESGGFPGPISYAWHGLGRVAYERGDLTMAATWYRRARHLARRIGSTDVEPLAALGLVTTRLCAQPAGVFRRATVLLEQGCAVATRHGFALPAVRAALATAAVSLHLGALDGAQMAAQKALERATSEGRRWEEGVARRFLGQCAMAFGVVAEAQTQARAALALLTEIGAALEAARTRVVLAQALAAQAGHGLVPDEARALLAEATDQFAISGATLDLARAEQLSALWRDR